MLRLRTLLDAFSTFPDGFRTVSDVFGRLLDAFGRLSDVFGRLSDVFERLSDVFRTAFGYRGRLSLILTAFRCRERRFADRPYPFFTTFFLRAQKMHETAHTRFFSRIAEKRRSMKQNWRMVDNVTRSNEFAVINLLFINLLCLRLIENYNSQRRRRRRGAAAAMGGHPTSTLQN